MMMTIMMTMNYLSETSINATLPNYQGNYNCNQTLLELVQIVSRILSLILPNNNNNDDDDDKIMILIPE